MPGTVAQKVEELFDVIVVGAGPSALATVARLLEPYPSALYTDVEHQRFAWMSRHHNSRARSHRSLKPKDHKSPAAPHSSHPNILVIDNSGAEWLASWKALFKACSISALRSPMFFHPDPSDIDSMISFAHSANRDDELVEITGVVGREISKNHNKRKRGKLAPRTDVNARDHQDYYRPSISLFTDFCVSILERYGIQDLVRQDKVERVTYGPIHVTGEGYLSDKHFRVSTSTGCCYGAKSVVLAVGMGQFPVIPSYLSDFPDGGSHSSQLVRKAFLSELLERRIKTGCPTAVVVVGGGLTSAQLVDKAIKLGVKRVYLLCRSRIKVKHFDFSLDWVAKFKNLNMASFWNEEDPEARLGIIREARNGGSINPPHWRILQEHERSGALTILQNTSVTAATFSADESRWQINVSTSGNTPITLPPIDYVYAATGNKPDISALPFLKDFVKEYPIEAHSGLPVLTDDLMWQEDIPLFVVGGYAALHVGPASFNLQGGRAGAERVALKMNDILGTPSILDNDAQRGGVLWRELRSRGMGFDELENI